MITGSKGSRKFVLLFLFVVTLFVFTNCEQVTVNEPKTLKQKVAYMYGSLTVIMDTTKSLLQAGKISPDTAMYIYQQGEVAKMLLDKVLELDKMGQSPDKTLAIVDGLIRTLQLEINFYRGGNQ